MAVCLCPNHLFSVPTPCLECVHASVHIFMSTLYTMSGPPPMNSYIESWVPCVSLHVCPSHLIFVPTPCLECLHASVHEFMSTWLLISGPHPMHSLMETWVSLYGSVFVSQSSHFYSDTFLGCVCASIHIFMPTLLPILAQPPMDSYMERWVPLFVTVCVPVTLPMFPYLV